MHCSGNRKAFRLRMVDNSRALSVCDDETPSCRLGRRLWLLAYGLRRKVHLCFRQSCLHVSLGGFFIQLEELQQLFAYLDVRNMIVPLALDKFQYRLVSAFRSAFCFAFRSAFCFAFRSASRLADYFAFRSEKLFAC